MNLNEGFVSQPWADRVKTKLAKGISSLSSVFEASSGLLFASTVLLLWFVSLFWLTPLSLSISSTGWVILAILGRTFLHTGLFIIAHDAMHGALFPANLKINHTLGAIALNCYALLPYNRSLKKHWQHHRQPAREGDPDFHDGQHRSFLGWYWCFMKRYLDRRQLVVILIGMSAIFWGLCLAFHVSPLNATLFWAVPSLLSSLQLFYFGTYLTHREPAEGYQNEHHSTSMNFPVFWSFLACYHFSYHWEHHEYPDLPWYKLPAARQR